MAAPYNAAADLFCSKLDPSGLYSLKFVTDSVRDTHFDGAVLVALGSDFTYIRKNGILKVGYNADYLDNLGVNYCRYKNPEFADQYIYAFITEIEYLAPNVSALHLSTDSFMTYQNDIALTEQYIARKTVDATEDRAIQYGYSMPEPITAGNYKLTECKRITFDTAVDFLTDFRIGIICKPFNLVGNSEWQLANETTDPNYQVKADLNGWCAHFLNGYPTGGNIFVANTVGELNIVSDLVNALGSEIIATFWIHNSESDGITFRDRLVTFYVNDVTSKIEKKDIQFHTIDTLRVKSLDFSGNDWGNTGTTIDGYEPANKKCFNYPYNYLQASDSNGTNIAYRYEDFISGDPVFVCKFIANTNNAIVVVPNNYMGTSGNLDHAIVVEGFPQIPYMSDLYMSYLGTHSAQTSIARYQRYMDYGKSLFNIGQANYHAMSGAANTLFDSVAAAKSNDTGAMISQGRANTGQIESTMKSLGNSVVGLGHSIDKSISAAAQAADSRQIDVVNASSPSTRATMGKLGVIFYHKYLCAHDIERIDQYFSRYGYSWEKIEAFDFDHCTDYEYIKTIGCNIEGTIPLADKQKLNTLFDTGITFWHDPARYGVFADSSNPNK